jgi:hypothetical protein
MSVPRLRRNITGVVSTGNGSARIDSTMAEEIASEALKTAQEALEAAKTLESAAAIASTLNNKLEAEILRSKGVDAQQEQRIDQLATLSPINIKFIDNIDPDILWKNN